MAVIKHKGILLVQGRTPRLIDPEGEALIVTPTASTISINESVTGQLEAKNTVELSATCARQNAVISWTTTEGSLNVQTGSTVILTYGTVPVTNFNNITVTATTQVDNNYQPTTLQKTAIITKVVPPKTQVELTLYQRSAQPPGILPSAATYNSSTRAIGGTLNSWQVTIPGGTNPLYITKATVEFYNSGINVARTVSGWQAQALLVQNGTNGSSGQDATVTLANMATAIQGNTNYLNTTTSTLYTDTLGNGTGEPTGSVTGVYIGRGGIYGKVGGTTSFAISASTGEARFSGKISIGTSVTGLQGPSGLLQLVDSSSSLRGAIGTVAADAGGQGIDGGTALVDWQTSGSLPAVAQLIARGQDSNWQSLSITHVQGSVGTICKIGWSSNGTGSAGLQSAKGNLNISAINGLSPADLSLQAGAIGSGLLTLSSKNLKMASNQPYRLIVGDDTASTGSNQSAAFVLARLSHARWEMRHDGPNFVLNYQTAGESGPNVNDYLFQMDGNFTARGNVTAYSDKIIKSGIKPISQATSKLKQINGYQYKNLLANKHDCGIIAQEIEKILPELVQVGSTEYEGGKLKTVNYNGVVALLVAANRELIARVEALEKQINATTILRSNKSK